MRYNARHFDLSGLKGISDATLEQHFKLYEGYVAQTNELIAKLSELNKDGGVDEKRMPEYSELKRRLGFEYNGMVLHELYFGNLRKHGDREPARGSSFREAVDASWHSYQKWEADFICVGKMRGVGWAVCYQDPATGALTNQWIEMHESGHVAGSEQVGSPAETHLADVPRGECPLRIGNGRHRLEYRAQDSVIRSHAEPTRLTSCTFPTGRLNTDNRNCRKASLRGCGECPLIKL